MKKGTKKTKVGASTPEKALFYKVTAKIAGKSYSQTGESVAEAISKFDIRNVKNVKTILIAERDGVTKEKILMPLQTNRLFNSRGLMREISLKNIATLFQGF